MKTLIVLALLCALAFLAFKTFRKTPPQAAASVASHAPRDIVALVRPLLKPAILIAKTGEATGSFFGGQPPAYSGFVWPERNGVPMTFLACFDCAEFPRIPELDWLPSGGHLLFFYDMEDEAWGFDPKDRGGWKTVYAGPEVVFPGTAASPPKALPRPPLPRKFITFRAASLPPAWDMEAIQSKALTREEDDAFLEYRQTLYGDLPHHQIGGYPDPVQGAEMDEECQLVSNGIYCGNAEGYQDPRVEKLKPGAAEWSLLFQMDTDDSMDLMWGDAGMIYFWVKRSDARARNFENTWLIFQCG